MTKFIVLNTVCKDGLGDFSHFEDIMTALLINPIFQQVEFIAIIYFETRIYRSSPQSQDEIIQRSTRNESIILKLLERLNVLGITYFFKPQDGSTVSNTEKTIEQVIAEADQGVGISYLGGPCLYYAEELIKKGVPVKFIGEHEVLPVGTDLIIRSLGLTKKAYGIKIRDIIPVEPHQAWSVILENDPEFAAQLLIKTNSESFEIFNHHHLIVPAYFNNLSDFRHFLIFLSFYPAITQSRHIVIYHSGNIIEDASFLHHDEFKNTSIEKLEIVLPGDISFNETFNPPTSPFLSITIFSGFHINNFSYNAIYQLAKIAGVSGDNTFEHCIAHGVLPFYRSTNAISKQLTLEALKNITQLPCFSLPIAVQKSFQLFFDPNAMSIFCWTSLGSSQSTHEGSITSKYANLDLIGMIQYWPIIGHYLKQNYNFYPKLEAILLEKLPGKLKNYLTSSSGTVAWWGNPLSFFKELFDLSQTEEVPQSKKTTKRPQ